MAMITMRRAVVFDEHRCVRDTVMIDDVAEEHDDDEIELVEHVDDEELV